MLHPSNRAGRAEGLPLTHRTCLEAAGNLAQPQCATAPRLWVQVRRAHAGGPIVLCGQLTELQERDGEWFGVETAIGHLWATGQHVRLCSGDGRCTCETSAAR
jgi:hypothetical protein